MKEAKPKLKYFFSVDFQWGIGRFWPGFSGCPRFVFLGFKMINEIPNRKTSIFWNAELLVSEKFLERKDRVLGYIKKSRVTYVLIICLTHPVIVHAQNASQQQTLNFFKELLENYSTNAAKPILEEILKFDTSLFLKTEVFGHGSNGNLVGYDSIQHILKPNPDSVDDLTIGFLNLHYGEKNAVSYVIWNLHCRYTLQNGKPKFEERSIYRITLSDIQYLLGNYEKEKFARKVSSTCSFYYEHPETKKKATIAVNCFLPCETKEGNTINSITITFEK